jgi:hypothetical protein
MPVVTRSQSKKLLEQSKQKKNDNIDNNYLDIILKNLASIILFICTIIELTIRTIIVLGILMLLLKLHLSHYPRF